MGVIKSQSIYSTIISYVGVIIGFVTSALIMPKVLTADQLGLVKLIVAVTGVFASVFSFGIRQVLNRTYPLYENTPDKLARLFYLSIKIALFGGIVALPIYYLTAFDVFNFDRTIPDFNKSNFFIHAVFVAIIFRILYLSLFGYVRMMSQIVIDSIIQNVFLKGGILIFILFYFFEIITFDGFVYAHIVLYLFFPLIIILYLLKNKKFPLYPKKTRFAASELREFFNLSLFGVLTTIGTSLYIYLDTLMVNFYLSESDVGIYGTMFLFGIIVAVPARGMKEISISVLSKAYNEDRFDEIDNVYKKSSMTLFLVGVFIFLGVYTNLYSVFEYLPHEFRQGTYVVLFIGLAQLTDMLCGVNYEIIASSKHYRLNTWFTLAAIVSAIILNMLFIPVYGISGAAFATLSSVFLVNFFRIIAVWKIFKIQPFTSKTIWALVVSTVFYIILVSIPTIEQPILNLLVKGVLLVILFLPTIYFLKLSEDINGIIDRFLKLNKS